MKNGDLKQDENISDAEQGRFASTARHSVRKEPEISRATWIRTAVIVFLLICGFDLLNEYIDKVKAHRCVPVDSTEYLIGVDSLEISGGVLELSGWCFKNGIDTVKTITTSQVMVILMNIVDEEEKYFMSSSITENEKLNEMFPLPGINYKYGGFEADIRSSKLDLDNKDYEILFAKMDYPWESDKFCLTAVRSGYSIVKGELKNNN